MRSSRIVSVLAALGSFVAGLQAGEVSLDEQVLLSPRVDGKTPYVLFAGKQSFENKGWIPSLYYPQGAPFSPLLASNTASTYDFKSLNVSVNSARQAKIRIRRGKIPVQTSQKALVKISEPQGEILIQKEISEDWPMLEDYKKQLQRLLNDPQWVVAPEEMKAGNDSASLLHSGRVESGHG